LLPRWSRSLGQPDVARRLRPARTRPACSLTHSRTTFARCMNDIVGIDLGTTNSLIGVMEAGFPILLADAHGERLTPSVVYFPETGEPLVGKPADRMRALEPAATVYSAKRLIGLRGEDISAEELPAGFA